MASEIIPPGADGEKALHALARKRAELDGRIIELRDQTRTLLIARDHVDATMRIFSPQIEIDKIRPKLKPAPYAAANGEVTHLIIDALRYAERPLTSRELTLRVMQERALDVVYTGESYDLRTRLLQHLTGVSHLHDRFLALQFAEALPGAPNVSTDPDEAYRALNEWLASRVVIGYRSCGYVRDAEAAILKATASPLNLARCAKTPFRAALMEMERRFDVEIGGSWPKRSYEGHRGRR
jgi:hypothetical protein